MRLPYPSRAASAVLVVSAPVLISGVVFIFVGEPAIGRLVAIAAVLGLIGSSLINHNRAD